GVGGKLVQHHRYCLPRLGAQDGVRSLNPRGGSRGVGSENPANEFGKREPMPLATAQQFMGGGHRSNTAVERNDKLRHGAAGFPGTSDDRRDNSEHVFDAMVEFSKSYPKRRFIASPFSEQRNQYERGERHHRYRDLGAIRAFGERNTRIAKLTYAEYCRPND